VFQKTFGRKVNIVGLVIGLAVLLLTAFPQQGAIYAQSTGGSGITLGRGAINDIAWSPDGKQIAIASSVGVWLYQSAQLTDEPQLIPSTRDTYSVAFSPDSKTLAFAGGDQLVNVWDIASKQTKGSYKGHKGSVYGLTFSPDGKTIASSSTDQTVIIRDAATGSIKQTLKGHTDYVTGVAFSPDGKTIASASDDGTVKLWTVATGKELRTLKQPDGGSSYLVTVAFSPDGKTVLAGGHTSTAFFWTAATGRAIASKLKKVKTVYRP
jgi:WD40 repeat protein